MRCCAFRQWVALLATLLAWLMLSTSAQAQLSTAESDPKTQGWMSGFPPPADKRVGQPYSDFWSFPKIRWSVCHLRELLPTRNVSRGTDPARALITSLDPDLAALAVPSGVGTAKPSDGPLRDVIAEHYTDGLLVLHKGVVKFEYYSGCLTPERPHATMSMTKSVVGLLAEILIAEQTLDDSQPVTHWVPELAESAFAGASLRQVLDMTTGAAFDETYTDPNSDIWVYASASDAMPKPADYTGPVGFLDFLVSLKRKEAEHGERFKYGTINTDVLGWILSRATGESVADLISTRLWKAMGAERDAYMKNDAMGIVHAGGGLNAGLRDLGRLGQLLLDGGKAGDEQVIPLAATQAILKGAATAVSTSSDIAAFWPGYRSMWWYGGSQSRPLIAARGVYGQTIYLDPVAEVVIVRLASDPQPSSRFIDPRVQPVYRAISDYLMGAER